MAWHTYWRREPSKNIPTATSAPWRIELPNGKVLHGRKNELVEEARKHNVGKLFNRQSKKWVQLEPVTDVTTAPLTPGKRV